MCTGLAAFAEAAREFCEVGHIPRTLGDNMKGSHLLAAEEELRCYVCNESYSASASKHLLPSCAVVDSMIAQMGALTGMLSEAPASQVAT